MFLFYVFVFGSDRKSTPLFFFTVHHRDEWKRSDITTVVHSALKDYLFRKSQFLNQNWEGIGLLQIVAAARFARAPT
jgi:hypothetical protein